MVATHGIQQLHTNNSILLNERMLSWDSHFILISLHAVWEAGYSCVQQCMGMNKDVTMERAAGVIVTGVVRRFFLRSLAVCTTKRRIVFIE